MAARPHPLLALAVAISLAATSARAQYQQQELGSMNQATLPYKADEVGVDEKLGATVPDDATFVDEDGNKVTVGSYLHHDRPVLLWLGYYECPMLCDRMSAGMVDAVKGIQLDAGKEFSILNVSIDPNESAGLAKAKKATYLKELGQPGNAAAWNLLTGSPKSIAALAGSVGYKFKKIDNKGVTEYVHPAVLIVLSPEGKVTRYLYPKAGPNVAADAKKLPFDATTMRLSLIEASEGRIGSVVDRVYLTCLHWDATAGAYTKDAVAIMQWGAALTMVVMGAFLVPVWVRAARGREKLRSDDETPGPRSMPA